MLFTCDIVNNEVAIQELEAAILDPLTQANHLPAPS
jgi:hypothetical protein